MVASYIVNVEAVIVSAPTGGVLWSVHGRSESPLATKAIPARGSLVDGSVDHRSVR